MTGSVKPIASLSSGLLARKGQARPAMRSQGFGGFGGVAQAADDLGWNDMGDAGTGSAIGDPTADGPGKPVPQVLLDRETLAAAVTPPPVVHAVSVPTATRIRRETQHAGKSAFTLRVDADRHLRLRLAGAIANRSAQDLVTMALDALIRSMPEVEALVAQLPAATGKR